MAGQKYYFRIRVDDESDNWQRFKTFLESKGGHILLACRETPADENPHFHALVEGKCSLEALRTARKRYFKDIPTMKGNGVASMSDCDKYEDFLEYLCKGEKAIKDKTDLTYKNKCKPNIIENNLGLDVMRYNKQFWERHHKDVPRKPKSHNTYKSYTETIVRSWCEHHSIEYSTAEVISEEQEVKIESDDEDELGDKVYDIKGPLQLSVGTDVVDWLIDFLSKENKPWDDYIIVRYANLIHYRYRHHFRHYVHTRKQQKMNILQKMGINEHD